MARRNTPKITQKRLEALAGILRATVRARFDTLTDTEGRRQPLIRHEDTQTEQDFTADKRLRAYAQSDHLYDNDDVGSTLDTCIRLAVGMDGGHPQFLDSPDAQAQFDAWKKSAGFAEGEHWQDMLELILRLVKLHGDCLILCHPQLTAGKLRVWDADQITSPHQADFEQWCRQVGGFDTGADGQPVLWRCVEGVVLDTDGRVQGYFVTSRRNRPGVPLSEATFLPASICRRVAHHRKHTQYRGEPLFLPNASLTEDTRDLIKSEVQAAKNAAEIAVAVIDPPTMGGGMAEAIAESGMTAEQLTAGTDTAAQEVVALLDRLSSADKETFKAFAGRSAVARFANGTTLQPLTNQGRPSGEIQTWLNNLADTNGKRMGVMSCLSRGRADASYSAGQIELAISWSAFERDQKMLERKVVDYVCSVLWPGRPYVVTWPKAFEIDPQKAEDTKDAALRGGRTTYREMLGPHWREKLLELAEEKKFLEENNLQNLSFFQGISGGRADAPAPKEQK